MKLVFNGVGLTLVLLASCPALAGVVSINSETAATLAQYKLVYNGKNVMDGEDLGEMTESSTHQVQTTGMAFSLTFRDLTAHDLYTNQLLPWGSDEYIEYLHWKYRSVEVLEQSLESAATASICGLVQQSFATCVAPDAATIWQGSMFVQTTLPPTNLNIQSYNLLNFYTPSYGRFFDAASQQVVTFAWHRFLVFESDKMAGFGLAGRAPNQTELMDWLAQTQVNYTYTAAFDNWQCANADSPLHECRRLSGQHLEFKAGQLQLKQAAVPAPAPISALVIALGGLCWWRRRAGAR
jgi:hypothetical protein